MASDERTSGARKPVSARSLVTRHRQQLALALKREPSSTRSQTDTEADEASRPNESACRHARSDCRRSMYSAIHTISRSLLRPSSTREPSGPPSEGFAQQMCRLDSIASASDDRRASRKFLLLWRAAVRPIEAPPRHLKARHRRLESRSISRVDDPCFSLPRSTSLIAFLTGAGKWRHRSIDRTPSIAGRSIGSSDG